MFKNKLKTFTILFVILTLISSVCFAVDAETISAELDEDIQAYDEEEYYSDEEDYSGEAYDEENYHSSDFRHANFDNYTVSKIIDGNAYIIGSEVIIDNEIAGDLFVITNKLTLTENSTVIGNLFVLSNEIYINGIVYDLYAYCTTLTVDVSGVIYRDLRAHAKNITMTGNVGRNMTVTCDDLTLSVEDTAGTIYGNLDYSTTKNPIIPSTSVLGEVIPTTRSSAFILNILKNIASTLIYVIAIWLVLTWLAPKFVEKITGYVPGKLLISGGIGLLVLVVVPIVAALLVFTEVGVTLSILLSGFFFVLAFAALPILSIALGKFVCSKITTPSKIKDLGFICLIALVFCGLGYIPYAGLVITLLAKILGLGMLILPLFKKEEV